MKSRIAFSTLFAVIFASLLSVSSADGAPASNGRLLHFPKDYPIGKLYLMDKPMGLETNIHARFWRRAHGDLVIPPKRLVYFEAEAGFFQHPECLLKLPPDAFDYIRLQFTSLEKNEEVMSDNALRFVRHLSGLKIVSLDQSDTTDSGAALLAGLTKMECLSFSESLVTGTCLSKLQNCKNLKFIRFAAGQVANDELRYLKSFPLLRRLTVARSGLILSGLKHIAECSNVRNLDIGHNPGINDSAIPYLKKMRLEELSLSDTKISYNGMMQLRNQKIGRITFPGTISQYSREQIREILKSFPHVDFKAGIAKKVDEDYQQIFSPTYH